MANLVDGSGDAGSNIVQGTGGNSLTFTMPGTVALNVESVVATIDNGAGGDTTATLTVADQSGEVIAKKRQGVVIPAGDTGTATWALRLDDETKAGGAGTTALETFNDATGIQETAGGTTFVPWKHNSGATLLDLTTPTQPTVIKDGFYVFSLVFLQTQFNLVPTAGRVSPVFFLPGLGVLPAAFASSITWTAVGVSASAASVSCTAFFPAGTTVGALIGNSQPVTMTYQLGCYLQQLA